jgi:hypothetical protein
MELKYLIVGSRIQGMWWERYMELGMFQQLQRIESVGVVVSHIEGIEAQQEPGFRLVSLVLEVVAAFLISVVDHSADRGE